MKIIDIWNQNNSAQVDTCGTPFNKMVADELWFSIQSDIHLTNMFQSI